jgi:3-deoxy-D-manno-octulosonic acid (KDO) 8-phosphate synthase
VSGLKTSAEALALWRQVAAGERSEGITRQLQAVARQLVAEVFEAKFDHAARRAEAALRAVGFAGQVDKYQELRQLADELDAKGTHSARQIAEVAPLIIDVPDQPKRLQKTIEAHRARRKR